MVGWSLGWVGLGMEGIEGGMSGEGVFYGVGFFVGMGKRGWLTGCVVFRELLWCGMGMLLRVG